MQKCNNKATMQNNNSEREAMPRKNKKTLHFAISK